MASKTLSLPAWLALVACLGLRGQAQGDGGLDLGFGLGGLVVEELTELEGAHLSHLAVRPEGRIVVAGWTGTFPARPFVARLLTDGTPDPSFGSGGVTFLGEEGYVTALTPLPDGGLAVAGRFPSLVRLAPDGSVAVVIPREGQAEVLALRLACGNSLLALEVRSGSTREPVVVRYGPTGVDRTFGAGGALPLPGGEGQDLSMLPDGSFLVASSERYDGRVRRFGRDGVPDGTFAGSGSLFLPGGRYLRLATVNGGFLVSAPLDGRLDVGRFSPDGQRDPRFAFEEIVPADPFTPAWSVIPRSGGGFVLWRDTQPLLGLTEWGARDEAFGSGGRLVLPGNLNLTELALASDGAFLACGALPGDCSQRGVVLRILSNGVLDSSFGKGGRLYPAVTAARYPVNPDHGVAMAATADGGILMVAATRSRILVYRYRHDGRPDASFGTGGRLEVDRNDLQVEPGCGYGVSIASRPDGKVVVAFGLDRVVVLRLNADGTFDLAFGDSGWIRLPAAMFSPQAIVFQRGGGMLVGGQGDRKVVLARVDDAGRLDHSFGEQGVVEKAFAYSSDWRGSYGSDLEALLERPDGRIVVVGHCWANAPADMLAARYLANGQLDPSFNQGSGWRRLKPQGLWGSAARAGVGLADGRIVLAGESHYLYGHDSVTLSCLLEDGRLDESFGGSGFVLTRLNRPEPTGIRVSRLVRQPDGRLLVTGWFIPWAAPDPYLSTAFLARFLPDGRLDSSFGSGGVVELRSTSPLGGIEAEDLEITGPLEVLVGGRHLSRQGSSLVHSLLLARFAVPTPVELVRFVAE